MSSNVTVRCPNCGTELEVPYVIVGAPQLCPTCLQDVVLEVPPGTTYPQTGYEITYADFKRLLGTSTTRSAVGRLLADWVGMTVETQGDRVVVRAPSGEPMDQVALHLDIQGDPDRQAAIYQVAMAAWR